jgi:hypothetical protein
LSITHFPEVGLFTGCHPLLERQAIGTETLPPVAGTEPSAQPLTPAGIERPHKLGVPSAKTSEPKTRTPHTGRSVLSDRGVGVALAHGYVDEISPALPADLH